MRFGSVLLKFVLFVQNGIIMSIVYLWITIMFRLAK